MNLLEVFDSLEVPETANQNLFNAVTLNDFSFAKVAVNNEGFPIILISSIESRPFAAQKNIRLKYLELAHNLECRATEVNNSYVQHFTAIILRATQPSLQQHFLGIAETLIKFLAAKPSQTEVLRIFKDFAEIFRALSESPTKTLQGLWAELMIIDTAKDPAKLIYYWHALPEEKFDFNANDEKLEVKSTSALERIHTFASEQLNPPDGTQVIIASVFVKQSSNGRSVSDLVSSIERKVPENGLVAKLLSVTSKTLGDSLEQSIKVKFDFDFARNSTRLYHHQDIHKIERVSIPNQISEVRYKSDLSDLRQIDQNRLQAGKELFKSIGI